MDEVKINPNPETIEKPPEQPGDKPSETPGSKPEPSDLEKARTAILDGDQPPKEESDKPPGTKDGDGLDEEIENIDMEEFLEKHPKLKSLGIESIEELASRYEGGLDTFNKDHEFIAELEKLDIKTPESRSELLARLKSGNLPPSPESIKSSQPYQPKNYSEARMVGLLNYVASNPAYQDVDPDTGRPIPMSEQQIIEKTKEISQLAETISPSYIGESAVRASQGVLFLLDELQWREYRDEPILNGSGGKRIDNSIRKQIREQRDKYPQTYAEIAQKAMAEGRNVYADWYNHMIATTKRAEIEKIREEKKAEAKVNADKKAKDAKPASGGVKSSSTSPKSFDNMTLLEKRAKIEAMGG